MNTFINAQILNMTAMTKTFTQACKIAALKDDGTINREEQRILAQIEKATARFMKELESIRR